MEYREFRAGAGEKDGKLFGIAAPFASETVIGDLKRGGWREEIAPGAFKKAIAEGDTVLLCDHDMSKPLARVSAGTLTLREEKDALYFEGEPAPTSYANDLFVNIRAKNKGGMSIGFDPVKDEWFDDKGNPSNRYVGTRRILREVKLPEISTVTNPAYKDTTLNARDALLAERESRAGNAPYGNVKYADPGYQKDGKKRYPIDTKKHIAAAWSYINQQRNQGFYTSAQLTKIKNKIKAAMAKVGMKAAAATRAEDLTGYCPRHGFAECAKRHDKTPAEIRIKKGTAKRVVQMHAETKQAMDLFGKCDIASLPQEAQDAIALVSSVQTHAGHVMDTEKLDSGDAARSEQEPETSTPAKKKDDLALRMAEAKQRSRDLGFL